MTQPKRSYVRINNANLISLQYVLNTSEGAISRYLFWKRQRKIESDKTVICKYNTKTCVYYMSCSQLLGEITRKLVAIIMTKTKSASRNAMLFLLLSARFGERHERARGRGAGAVVASHRVAFHTQNITVTITASFAVQSKLAVKERSM